MKKLRLNPDDLRVDAFVTLPTGGHGTVNGREQAVTIITITPAITPYCTRLEDYSCYEDCTTQGEDLSCRATCESVTHYAPTCPYCNAQQTVAGAGAV
jgi:hypothetical protein